jgi:hypothetical protein
MTGVLNTKEAAAYLKVTVQTLATWRWRNIGPRWTKTGRSVKYRPADLDAFLARNEVIPAA